MDSFKAAWTPLLGGSNVAQISLLTLVVLSSPLILTYLYTSAQTKTGGQDNGACVPPPEAPYWLPVLGDALSLGSDPTKYIKGLKRRFGMRPVKITVAGEKMIYVPHGDKMVTSFLDAKELHSGPLAEKHQRDSFNFPESDMTIYKRDDSGVQTKPRPGSTADPNKRLIYETHLVIHTMLNGAGMNMLLEKSLELLVQSLEAKRKEYSNWTELPDLSEFVRDELFSAVLRALCGNRIFDVTPTLLDDFWAFDLAMPSLFKGLPRWLAPKAYAARDKMAENIKKWHQDPVTAEAYERYIANPESTPDWDPIIGHPLMRTHSKLLLDYGISLDGRVASELGLTWGAMTNLITSSIWPILNAVLSPDVAERVRAETTACFAEGSLDIQKQKLSSCNLINSMYMESLRYAIAVTIARTPWPETGYNMGNWALKRNEVIFTVSALAHLDETFWNSGHLIDGKPEHPASQFWAERFLEYPGDPLSGPIKKYKDGAPVYSAAEKPSPRTPADDAQAKLITHGLSSHYFPYGGGIKICPGRHFAKQLILAVVPTFLRAFDFEYTNPKKAAETKPDYHYFMFGSLSPDRKNPVNVRARKL